MTQITRRYRVGEDFTEEEYHKWINQLTWWVGETMPKIEDSAEQAKMILKAAMNGTTLIGKTWNNISPNFFKRVKQLSGFDLELGVGFRRPESKATTKSGPKITDDDLPPINMHEYLAKVQQYKKDLIAKYPHLLNPIYDPKVEELAETIIKSRMIAPEFITATGKSLENYSKIRESLHKQIEELMNLLEIAPKQLLSKQREIDSADLGSLVAKLESYGQVWQEYERLDALRELIQTYHQLKALRPDGTPQLNDWELWHKTRNRPVKFRCRCGEEYELLGGFTAEEIEQALLQAYETYGFGLTGIEENEQLKAVIDPSVLASGIIEEEVNGNQRESIEDSTE